MYGSNDHLIQILMYGSNDHLIQILMYGSNDHLIQILMYGSNDHLIQILMYGSNDFNSVSNESIIQETILFITKSGRFMKLEAFS